MEGQITRMGIKEWRESVPDILHSHSLVLICCHVHAGTYKDGFTHCAALDNVHGDKKKLPAEIAELITPQLFKHLDFTTQLLQPFTKAIAVLERNNANLSEVWITFIKLQQFLRGVNTEMFPI